MATIAETSGISYKTVANISSIFKKQLGLRDAADPIKFSADIFRKHRDIEDLIIEKFCRFHY